MRVRSQPRGTHRRLVHCRRLRLWPRGIRGRPQHLRSHEADERRVVLDRIAGYADGSRKGDGTESSVGHICQLHHQSCWIYGNVSLIGVSRLILQLRGQLRDQRGDGRATRSTRNANWSVWRSLSRHAGPDRSGRDRDRDTSGSWAGRRRPGSPMPHAGSSAYRPFRGYQTEPTAKSRAWDPTPGKRPSALSIELMGCARASRGSTESGPGFRQYDRGRSSTFSPT